MKYALLCFLMGLMNIPFIVFRYGWWEINLFSGIFCFSLGVFICYRELKHGTGWTSLSLGTLDDSRYVPFDPSGDPVEECAMIGVDETFRLKKNRGTVPYKTRFPVVEKGKK